MSINSNLYPPIVHDTIPSFIRTAPCNIYFSLSNYNSAADIKNVQISLVNQRTNTSAFKTTMYPSGIKIASLTKDEDKEGDYNYYVTINPTDLATGTFGINQFYKVQLRFTSNSASDPPTTGTQLAQWLYAYRSCFSEWSKVCLIKGIETPKILLRGFEEMDENELNQNTVLMTEIIDIIGEMYYPTGTEEKEYLKNYNIKIYNINNIIQPLFDSGEVYTNPYNPNEINYELTYKLTDGEEYLLIFTYTTNNLYTDSKKYQFSVIQRGINKLENATITATPDEENGRILVNVSSPNSFMGNLTFRRTSSKSNFHKWEDIKTVTILSETSQDLNYSFYDTTIESGVWYKYCVQRRNGKGDRGVILPTDREVMCLLEHIFLTKNGCQLKIKLNPSLNEFKYNVTESQQTTIGSQYPYVKRNSNNYFRTFPIGGLISSFIDTTDWYDPHFYDGYFHNGENEIKAFTSKEEIYGQSLEKYAKYNFDNNITQYNDYIYEREFRKKVYDFLYKHDIKLFRSTTEGNILIKLMNIDFQPVQALGRMLYSFTATAVEVDEANLENYEKYGIQEIGTYQNQVIYTRTLLGQVRSTFTISKDLNGIPETYNIVDSVIGKKYRDKAAAGFINQVNHLEWLRIEISSPPYLIIEGSDGPIKVNSSFVTEKNKITFGYIVQINGQKMIIHPRMIRRTSNATLTHPGYRSSGDTDPTSITYIGYFELKEPNTQITELRFLEQTTATIDYLVSLSTIEDTSKLPRKTIFSKVQGQLFGTFTKKDQLYGKIYSKYRCNYSDFYQELLDIIQLRIETQPGAVVQIKDSKDTDFNRHVIQNGYLQLKEEEIFFDKIQFYGMHLIENNDPSSFIRKNEFIIVDNSSSYTETNEILNPVRNGVYRFKKSNNNYYYQIYYDNNWYQFTEDNDVICPVDGSINYYCEVVKGVY